MNALAFLSHDPWIQRLGWVLIHFLWQGAAIGLLLAVLLPLLNRASSHLRYLVTCAALLACAIAPAITWAVLAREESRVFQFSQVIPGNAGLGAFFSAPPPLSPAPVVEGSGPESPAAAGEPGLMTSWRALGLRMLGEALPYAVIFWFGGVLALTARLALGWAGLQRLRRSASAIPDPVWQERLRNLAAKMRVSAPVRLLESALVEVPTLIGWLRPVILLPATVFTGLSPAQIEAVLAHELAHIRRCDYLVNLIQTVIETALFYHPAVWWISRKLSEERENCCDDIAIETTQDRAIYARALATLEQSRACSSPLALAASGAPLLARIRRIAGVDSRKSSLAATIAAAVLLGGLVMLAVAKESSPPTSQELILRLNRFVEGVTSLQFTQITGSVPDDYEKIVWQEAGTAYRFDDLRISKGPPPGPHVINNWHRLTSYDGDRTYDFVRDEGRIFTQREPPSRLASDFDPVLLGPLTPFDFLLTSGTRRGNIKTLESREYLAGVAKRAALDPSKDRVWEGHHCVAVKITDGYNRWFDSNKSVDYLVYFASDLDYYPVAWEMYDKKGVLEIAYWIKKLTAIPFGRGNNAGFRYPEVAIMRQPPFSFERQITFPDVEVNNLTKADFRLGPTLAMYIRDGEDPGKLRYTEDKDTRRLTDFDYRDQVSTAAPIDGGNKMPPLSSASPGGSTNGTNAALALPAESPLSTASTQSAAAELYTLFDKLTNDTRAMFEAGKWDDLERTARELRTSKARFPDGNWKLFSFYNGLDPQNFARSDDQWTQWFNQLDQWKKAYPNSITQCVARGIAFEEYGWNARGTSWSNEVKPQGWPLFAERTAQARKVLEEGENLPDKCPGWYIAMLKVALAQGWNRAETEKLFKNAVAFEPTCTLFYTQYALYLLPRWYGKEGDWEQLAEQAAKVYDPAEGMAMYTRVATNLSGYYTDFFKDTGITWPRMKQGFIDIEKSYPNCSFNLCVYFKYAVMAGDRETASGLLKRIGDKPDLNAWHTPTGFQRAKAWTIAGDSGTDAATTPGIFRTGTSASSLPLR